MTLRESLLRFPLFALLPSRQMDEWLDASEDHEFAAGELLFREGSTGEWLYVVDQGRVRIVRSLKRGREIPVGIAGPGDVFGDYALLRPHENTATCRAVIDSRIARLPLQQLRAALSADITSNLKRWLQLHAVLHCLRGGPVLGFMSASSALRHLDYLEPTKFQQGTTIQADGLGENYWYFVEQGSVALHLPDGSVRDLKNGDCFGERALLNWKGLPIAVATEETSCLRISRADFCEDELQSANGQTITFAGGAKGDYVWLGQKGSWDCGLACLRMVASFHRRHLALDKLGTHAKGDDACLSLRDLQLFAQSAGLIGQAVRVDSSHLEDVTLPAIAHLKSGHFVVLFEHGHRGVVIGDPATSIVSLTEPEFWRMASGSMLLMEPSTIPHSSRTI
jgi:CRP-like cAMP-binding protein